MKVINTNPYIDKNHISLNAVKHSNKSFIRLNLHRFIVWIYTTRTLVNLQEFIYYTYYIIYVYYIQETNLLVWAAIKTLDSRVTVNSGNKCLIMSSRMIFSSQIFLERN